MMPKIPELTQNQLDIMLEVCKSEILNTFSQMIPNLDDAPSLQIEMDKNNADVDYLESLGLVKNVSEEPKIKTKLAEIFTETKRNWRVYSVEPLGRALFQAECSPRVH